MELRRYAEAKAIVDQIEKASIRAAATGGEMPEVPETPMVRRVVEIKRELEG